MTAVELDLQTRCDESDLPVGTCAHCRGDDPTIQPGEPLRGDVPSGVAVWPVRETKPDYVPRPTETHTDDEKVKVARDLRQIRFMATTLLPERGIDLGADSSMPGGDATATAAAVALPSAWERRWELIEADWMRKQAFTLAMETMVTENAKGRPAPEVDDWEPPLQSLLYWSELWRYQLDMAHEGWTNPTLLSEVNFLASGDVLDWAHTHVPAFPSFAADIADTRTRLENVVRDGVRETRSRIVCDRCPAGKRLILRYGKGNQPHTYKCQACKAVLTADEATRAHAKQMRAEGAEKWITTTEAVAALAVQGWQQRTVRSWIEPLRPIDRCDDCRRTWPAQEYAACPNKRWIDGEEVECGGFLTTLYRGDRNQVPGSYCDIATRRTFAWWPDLWRRHLMAKAARDTRKNNRP